MSYTLLPSLLGRARNFAAATAMIFAVFISGAFAQTGTSTNENLPANSLIIAMDNEW